ncbi:GDSL esterase/lipase At1g29670-like [Alnus glutinosa]|uniref:GDSL esterase/lipase At1g29670-like n=1 Tax=Alnus glutinosa TaxID=3517 RepID=UPI002D784150|nr:GDSL esterase/lipase At1g29670-like [Alnus glutinosa]
MAASDDDQLQALWWMLLLLVLLQGGCANGKPLVPCLFVFGDSSFDNGNNNNLLTEAKSNYPPYGIDFPLGPTGRFSNGRNSMDFIAQFLGFDHYIPPFANAKGPEILQGVNYASGAAGIRDETGQHQGDRISMNRQLKNHQTTVSEINQRLGNDISTTVYLNKCLYFVSIGQNDYLNNYFLPEFYPTSRLYTQLQYPLLLIQQLSQQLMSLYNYGAKKFVVVGPIALASTPFEHVSCGLIGSPCLDNIYNAVELFNDLLKSLVDQLNNNVNLEFSTFIFINTSGLLMSSSSARGSMVTDFSCCEMWPTGLAPAVQCKPFGKSCSTRSEYMFWDGVHPTEAANLAYAEGAYNAYSPSHAYPFNISHLAQL